MSMARSTPAQKPRGLASNMRMPASTSGSCPGLAPRFQQRVQQYQPGTDGDATVCHIECRKPVLTPVHQQEIDHIAVPQPVDDIAQRTADYENQASRLQLLRRGIDPAQ